jgi:hypothetical protein
MKLKIFPITICIFLSLPVTILAVEVAPRISDREIVEKLVSLEVGQNALQSAMSAGQDSLRFEIKSGHDALRSEIKAGQDTLRAEIKAGQDTLRVEMKAGQDTLRAEMRSGQDALGKRMDDINQRISSQQLTMLALFGAMIALILALFAYIAWDRRTMIKPVVERLEHLEDKLLRELDMNHDKGSSITRLINALRELAKQDEKVATVLRNFSLL